jgi:hypothetical protein
MDDPNDAPKKPLPKEITDQLRVGRGRYPEKRTLLSGNEGEAHNQVQRILDRLIAKHSPVAAEMQKQKQMWDDYELILGSFIRDDNDRTRQKHGLLISGPRGLGKTTLVRGMLQATMTEKEYAERVKWETHQELNIAHLFEIFRRAPDASSIHLLDDLDGIWDKRPLLQMMLAALETGKEARVISYRPPRPSDLPEKQTVEFRAKIITITNEDPAHLIATKPRMGEHIDALLSRVIHLDFDILSPEEQLANALDRIRGGMLDDIGLNAKNQLFPYVTWLEKERDRLKLDLRVVKDMAVYFKEYNVPTAKRLALRVGYRRATRRERRAAKMA